MLLNIFGKKESNGQAKPVIVKSSSSSERQSRALKIVHAGGHAEHHYMAIPASMVIEKHHSFVLARPEIFRRPWDSVVRPNEILIPGQKYYLVPRRTVKKLRRRIRRTPTMDLPQDSISSISGILIKPGRKVKARDRHVKWLDIANQKPGPVSLHSDKKHGNNKEKKNRKERLMKPGPMDERARNENAWEPSLNSINEY